MPTVTRTTLAAILILLVFLSLPFWLPGAVAARQLTPDRTPTLDLSVDEPDDNPHASFPELTGAALNLENLPAMTLIDAGWVRGASTAQERIHPPAVLRWQPLHSSPDWRVETGHVWDAYQDGQGRLYLAEQDSLIVLDRESSRVIREYEIDQMATGGPNAGHPFPIGRDGDRLYLRNYAAGKNLFVFDLESGTLFDESYSVCEYGRPFESRYLSRERSVVTFCLDFSTGIQGYLTKLMLGDGEQISVQIPSLGTEEYMAGNGFALAGDLLAYVVDSDAGSLVEIDLETMSVQRQARYLPASKAGNGLASFVARLIDLGAAPAHAKRWMSYPAVSPDGRYMVVDGGFLANDGRNSTSWLIDLERLEPIRRIELPRTPVRFQFASESLVYVLLETQHAEQSQVLAYDIESGSSALLDLPTPGRVVQILP